MFIILYKTPVFQAKQKSVQTLLFERNKMI